MMRAMILAAGYGTRLWPLTIDRAKPAIPFMGQPLVGYVAEYLARFGCDEVVVNLHHQAQTVRDALGDGRHFGVRMHYVEESVILGTSGALDNARHLLDGDTFIVINGKIATDIDLSEALRTHRAANAIATLILKPNPRRERFSTVLVDGGLLQEFGPHPQTSSVSDNVGDVPLMFTGIQILEPRIFSYIPRGVFSHSTTEVYPQAIARGERIAAHISDGMWHELSTIRRYLETSIELLQHEGRDVIAGQDSHVSVSADVREAVLWENVIVDAGARIRRAVIGAGVHVGSGEVIENAVVVRAELVEGTERPPQALAGEMRGANFVAPIMG